jgi:hypothetical protein
LPPQIGLHDKKHFLVIANLRSHKLSFSRNLFFLEENGFFLGGGSIKGAPKMVFGTIPCILAIPETRSKMSKSRIHRMPKFYSAFLSVRNH